MEMQDTLDLFAEQGKFVKGRPIVTIFHNEQNLYTVLRIRVDETNDQYDDKEAVITGYFPKIHEQETYIFFGEFKEHPKFGLQFHTKHFRKDMPQTKQGVIAYLSGKCSKASGKRQRRTLWKLLAKMRFQKYSISRHYLIPFQSFLRKKPKRFMIP